MIAGVLKPVYFTAEKEKLLKDRPDDPALLWEIGRIRFLELDDPSGALGYFLFLGENHPGYEKVKSGDCQYMVAEAWYRLKILRHAYLAYRRLKEDYSHHAMVSPSGNGKGSTVAGKITECFRLATKLGWKLTDGR